jgi:clan AA aspartic protease (TIGR02281 family)
MSDYAIVTAARNRAAIGRAIVGTLTGALLGGMALISHLGGGSADPAGVDPPSGTGHRIVVAGDAYGQCHVAAVINGLLFRSLLLDSGAAGHLTFGRNHAAQLGFDPAKLTYDRRYGSANGVGHYASVRVREFRLDSFVLRDVPADITAAPQDEPLLGIDVLRRLNFRLKDGSCEISWS